MKLLLVAATSFEIQPFISYYSSTELERKHDVDVLVTGVGMVATAFSLGRKFSEGRYDFAINAGIAGSFNKNIEIGETVVVKDDRFVELGAEDNESFLSIEELGFGISTYFSSFTNSFLESLKAVSGITVNKVHGRLSSIESTLNLFNPDVESMEGAAFLFACREVDIPAVELRSISNYVEPRNRDSWQITLAITNLNDTLIRFVEHLSKDE
ncbi:futalosine hydrolase [Desertivirga brevis]|uniref:futalosine hydrolase n=1 Tax=Desertivirga brevis TaxID=2810310 RepID=UPI001A956C26|nr:futalosine hydrolase [Pedobacter sp. SYSU D00873]